MVVGYDDVAFGFSAESNWPFYEKSAGLVQATRYWGELDYGFRYNNAGRTPDSHGRCPGGREGKPYFCHHCQTIEAATKLFMQLI